MRRANLEPRALAALGAKLPVNHEMKSSQVILEDLVPSAGLLPPSPEPRVRSATVVGESAAFGPVHADR